MSKSSPSASTQNEQSDDLRQRAIQSLLNESEKRKTLSERMGSEAFYITRYCPAKADIDFINRHIRRVNGHNKRWEEEKCYTIKKNMEKIDREKRRKRSEPVEDKYKAEKEYWKVEKALKFSNKEGDKKEIVEELGIDKSNMFLFPTIASCTSSDEDQKKKKHHHRHRHHRDGSSPFCFNKHKMLKFQRHHR